MEVNWSPLINIGIGLVVLLVGWAIGFFDSKLRADKKIRQAEEKARLAAEQAKADAGRAAARLAEAEKRVAAAAASPSLPGTSLLRLWLDDHERPALDLDGRQVVTSQISEPNRKRLIALVTMMRPWIEGKPDAQVQVPPPPINAGLAPRPATLDVEAIPIPPGNPVETTGQNGEEAAAPQGIVGQIDKILQEKLAVSPLARRGIRLQESSSGGVIVWVGTQKFTGVGEVTDPDVQVILRAAIAEWEKKYTPGM